MFDDKFDDKILEHIEEKEKFPIFPLPLIVKKAENSCLYDTKGKMYIDLTSNKEINPLGYTKIIKANENYFSDSELFSSCFSTKLEEVLKSATGLKKAYFSSNLSDLHKLTGMLINKHLNKIGKNKVLLSSTTANKDLYTITNFTTESIPLNKDSLVKTLFSRTVGAVIIEIVQITDEILVAQTEYLKEIRRLCDKNNALLVFDVSCIAPLRLNKDLFNYNSEIKPDILILSKGLNQGLPLSSIIVSEKTPDMENIETKAGVCSSAYTDACELVENFQTNKIGEIINSNIEYITKKLGDLAEIHISLVDYYSTGMFFTMVVDISAYDFAKEAFNKGVIVNTLNDSKILLSPPYNIKNEEIDSFISIFDKVFDQLAQFDRLK